MTLQLIDFLGLGWCFVAGGVIYHVIALTAMRLRAKADRSTLAHRHDPMAEPHGVTVLKPLCGCDEELEQNLTSFAQQSWRPMQILLGAADAHDPALAVARRVAERFPAVDIQVICEPTLDYANPKVQVLEMLSRHAKYGFIMISDSNVQAEPDDLGSLMTVAADPNIGLVYQRVVGVGEQSVWAALENLKLSDFAGAGITALKHVIGADAVMGKGMLLRREALDSIGGWPAVADVAAEDYVLGQSLHKAGWLVELAPVAARTVHVRWSWSGFWNRAVRHAALRFRLSPWTFPLELLLINPVSLTFAMMMCVGLSVLPAFLAACLVRIVADTIVLRWLRGTAMRPAFMLLAPVKDLLLAASWFRALFVQQIGWRGTMMRLGWGTRLSQTGSPFERELEHTEVHGLRGPSRQEGRTTRI
ncbi:MAG: glycosyltransferase [Planctomycetes bacterium]|nr:glycosyltransferase [Planctomycetota bacterium]